MGGIRGYNYHEKFLGRGKEVMVNIGLTLGIV